MGRRDPVVSECLLEVGHDSGDGHAGPVLAAALWCLLSGVGFGAAVLMRDTMPTWSLMFLTLAVAFFVLLVGSIAAALPRRKDRLRVCQVPGGLEVVGSPWPQRFGFPAAAVMITGAVIAVLDFTSAPDVLTPTVILVGFAGASCWSAIRYAAGLRPVDRVRLSRAGFLTRIRGSEVERSWGDVSGFGVGKKGLVVEVHEEHETDAVASVIPIAELRSDPVLLAELLEFYRAHERLRGELASGAVLDRIRQGTFRPEAS